MDNHIILELLNQKVEEFNTPSYIETDPIQIPHQFSLIQDIEISAFLAATIAWGNRKSIINDAHKMMNYMDNDPFEFITNCTSKDLDKIKEGAIHRTFNSEDFKYFILSLKRIYQKHNSLENLFLLKEGEKDMFHALHRFRDEFINQDEHRSNKHVSSSYKNSACKRLMMFLRWMVRKDNKGVDFGIWQDIDPKFLSCPLDVHSGNVSRKLGILQRKQNDWKAVRELDLALRKYNPNDPAVYDYALFGLGVFENF